MKSNINLNFFFIVILLVSIFFSNNILSYIKEPEINRIVEFPVVKKGEVLFQDVDGSDWLLDKEYQSKNDINFNGKKLHFNHTEVTNDDWDYISIDPNKEKWINYSWEFDIKRMTQFREFAFNFRNVDFDNRYRYRFEDNKIFFDKKVKAHWINNIASINYPLEQNKSYHVRIDVIDSIMRCYVDGVLQLENVDTDLPQGTIAIILWEDDRKTRIEAEVSNNIVRELIRVPLKTSE